MRLFIRVITAPKDIQEFTEQIRQEGKIIGLVPTMGFLHEGHLSLVRESVKKCDFTIVSIFVNPTQFAPNEDFKDYPRDLERDKKLLQEAGASLVFHPDEKDIYSENFQTYVEVKNITQILEGESRPTHFRGVTTIVSILFNCVIPHYAFFGQKDAQQIAVIKRMVKDLKINIGIEVCPISRESDGLAMSSRNIYLNTNERQDALVLSRSLNIAKELINDGTRDVNKIVSEMKSIIDSVDSSELDYIRFVKSDSFKEVIELKQNNEYFGLIACKIGKTRLIDNTFIKL